MAYDIGPKIGIDGENEFRKQLQLVNTSLKTLGSEMKVVTSAFIGNENSVEALAAQNEVLTKTIDAQKDKIKQQNNFLDRARELYGDTAEETLKWERAVNESTAELNKMEAQMRNNEKRMDGFGDEVEDVEQNLKDAGDAGVNFGDVLKANVLGGAIVEGIKATAGAIKDLAMELWSLDDATEEFRASQAMLTAAFESNGHEAETARKAYAGLFKVIGDSDEATEASQLLANLAGSTEDVDTWVKIAAGSWGRFGKALPITSLIEAANEAAKTGESVSALDDALNWIGLNAEAFGEQLAATATEEERLTLITETLSAAYSEAADSFYTGNEELVKARQNEILLQEASAKLGGAVSTLKNRLLDEFAPSVNTAAEAFSDMMLGVEGSDERFEEAIGNLIEKGAEKLPDFISMGGQFMGSVLSGLISNPTAIADGAIGAVGAIVDELTNPENIAEMVTSGALLIGELAVGLVEGIPEVVSRVPEIAGAIVEEFRENKQSFIDVGKDLIAGVNEGMQQASDWLWENAQGLLTGITAGVNAANQVNIPVVTGQVSESVAAQNDAALKAWGESIVNGVSAGITGMTGMTGPTSINLMTPEGDALARWQLPSLISVANAAGTPIVSAK